MAKRKPMVHRYWVYGKHPRPNTWHETVDVLRGIEAEKKKGSKSLGDHIETLVRELKGK